MTNAQHTESLNTLYDECFARGVEWAMHGNKTLPSSFVHGGHSYPVLRSSALPGIHFVKGWKSAK